MTITNLSRNKEAVERRLVKRTIVETLRRAGGEGEVSVAIVDDAAIEELNARFRGERRPTDVLAFNLRGEKETGAGLLGEIVISVDTAQRQAKRFHQPLKREILRYLIHGALHLVGLEDGSDRQRRTMRRRENEILAALSPDGRIKKGKVDPGRMKK